MMRAALEGLEEGTPAGRKRPSLIAVTQLTSTSEQVAKEELLLAKAAVRNGRALRQNGGRVRAGRSGMFGT